MVLFLTATIMEVENMSPWTSQYGPITANLQVDALMKELSIFGCVYQQSPVPCKSEFTIQSVMRSNTKCVMKLEARMLNGERYPHGGVQVEAEMRTKAHNGAVVYGEMEICPFSESHRRAERSQEAVTSCCALGSQSQLITGAV